MKLIITILVIILYAADSLGQDDTLKQKNDTLPKRFYLIQNVKRDGVTMPEVEIKEVTVIAHPSRAQKNEYRKYEKLITNVKRVYPKC